MTPITVVIVDDEPVARRRLRRLLSAGPGVQVVGEAGDGQEAVSLVREVRPDVLLLDTQMPEMSGLRVVANLARPRPHIVFVTAHDTHAVEAFELHALDYLLKPVTAARLAEAIGRAKAARRSRTADNRLDAWGEWSDPTRPVTRLPVHSTGRIDLVPVQAIDWNRPTTTRSSTAAAGATSSARRWGVWRLGSIHDNSNASTVRPSFAATPSSAWSRLPMATGA